MEEIIITDPLDLETKNIEENTALELKSTFMPFFEQADKLSKKAKEILVTNVNQIEEMTQARNARLKLKDIRVEVEKKRKSLKEESLLKGKAIDGIANIIKHLVIPIEKYLQEQEDFRKIQEERHKSDLIDKRENELSEYGVEVEFYNLGEMSDGGYNQLLQTSKLVFEQKIEAERKEEEKQIAKEKAEAEERKRIRSENEQLKKEAEERDRAEEERIVKEKIRAEKVRKEKVTFENKLKKERKEKEKIANELKEKQEAEKRIKDEAERKLKADIQAKEKIERDERLAPDKKKLEKLAIAIQEIPMPEVTSKEAKTILENVVELLNKTSNFIKQKSINL